MKLFKHKRITGDGIEYYNPFRPRIEKVKIVPEKYEHRISDKYFTNGNYLILLREDPKFKGIGSLPENFKETIFPKRLGNGTRLLAEFLVNGGNDPAAHVKGNGLEGFFNPKYIDSILTLYPDSTPYLSKMRTPGKHNALYFHKDGHIVGVIAPFKNPESYKQKLMNSPLRSRVKELEGR